MSSRRSVNPTPLYRGVPYDYATVVPAGALVLTAGACPLDADGLVAAPGDLEAQTHEVLDNLAVTLIEAGSSLADIVKTTVYVAASERSELVRVWSVVEERLRPASPPSTLLGVSLLGYADQLVEIEAVALVSCGGMSDSASRGTR